MGLSLFFLLFLCSIQLCSSAPLQIVNTNGMYSTDFTITKFLKGRFMDTKKLNAVSVLDCTGAGDCKLVNKLLGTTFKGVNGISLDVVKDTAVLYATFNSTFSNKFCGAKAIDYQCSLSNSVIHPCIAIGMSATDIELALHSYDQIFRRLLKYAHDHKMERRLTITVLLDESGVDEASVSDYAQKVEAFLNNLWRDQYEKEEFPSALKVEVILVRTDDPVLLEDAKTRLHHILNNQLHHISLPSAEDVAGSGIIAEGVVTAEQWAGALSKAWREIATNVQPVLSLTQREALYAIEAAAANGRSQADAAVRQWQTRVAKGRTVGKFSARVGQLLSVLRKDFYQRTSGQAAISLVRERGDRLLTLRQHVLSSAGRLFFQQLVVLEFHCVAGFKRQLCKLIARDDLDEAQMKEQEQVELRKALFDYRAQVSDLEDATLGFVVTAERIAELTSTLESVLSEFPDTPTAKLEEVRKMERLAQRGKLAATPRSGRARKRKGLSKALGVSLGLVGMLRPPGYGSLQGYIGYATSLLGLPLDLMLGVQNDGETPEIKGEDREYPLLRLQPKLKFDIDL